jgi:hypothetical protein
VQGGNISKHHNLVAISLFARYLNVVLLAMILVLKMQKRPLCIHVTTIVYKYDAPNLINLGLLNFTSSESLMRILNEESRFKAVDFLI